VRERFGPAVSEIVGWVTMPPSPPEDKERVRAAYLAHLLEAPSHVRAVKLADRYSNVQRLTDHPRPEKQRSYFTETAGHLVPLAAGDVFFRPLFLAWQRRVGEALAHR
jgi:(p)ppGpp synthase/HD superfamily hydrolase